VSIQVFGKEFLYLPEETIIELQSLAVACWMLSRLLIAGCPQVADSRVGSAPMSSISRAATATPVS